jgi:hypothetical protein
VTLSGSSLLAGGSNITSLTLGDVQTTVQTLNNDEIVFVVGAGGIANATVNVTFVMNTGAEVTFVDAWTHSVAASIVTVSPNSGHYGTVVNITGTNLLAGGASIVSVSLAGTNVDSILDDDQDSFVTVVAAASAAATGDVVVVSDNGATTTLENGFTYITPGEITSLVPGSGQYGTVVTIVGTNLLGGGATLDSVQLKEVEVFDIVLATDEKVIVVADTSAAGAGEVYLVADTGATVIAPCL